MLVLFHFVELFVIKYYFLWKSLFYYYFFQADVKSLTFEHYLSIACFYLLIFVVKNNHVSKGCLLNIKLHIDFADL